MPRGRMVKLPVSAAAPLCLSAALLTLVGVLDKEPSPPNQAETVLLTQYEFCAVIAA